MLLGPPLGLASRRPACWYAAPTVAQQQGVMSICWRPPFGCQDDLHSFGAWSVCVRVLVKALVVLLRA